MDKVGQMVQLHDALLWFTGVQWRRVVLLSRGSCKVCAETSCLLCSDKQPQMKRLDRLFWSKGSSGWCWRGDRELETKVKENRSQRSGMDQPDKVTYLWGTQVLTVTNGFEKSQLR